MLKLYASILLFLFSSIVSLPIYAEVVGNVVLIEDSDGSIHSDMITYGFQMRAACAFYREMPDSYDALFIYTTRSLGMLANVASGFPVYSPSLGTGLEMGDSRAQFCSTRLRHAVKMGSLNYITDDPDTTYSGIFGFTLSTLELMGHEFGHQWLANASFDLNDGNGTQCLLRAYTGNGGGSTTGETCNGHPAEDFNRHWSIYLNQPSVMYANTIEPIDDTHFHLTREALKYGELDQYLMGLRLANEVSPSFVVKTPYLSDTDGFPVAQGSERTVEGERVDVSIGDIVRVLGDRDPPLERCHWKAAFVIVYDPGQRPTPNQIELVNSYRGWWEEWYSWATDGRGSFDTRLDGCGTGTETCPGEASEQCGSLPDGDADAEGDCTFNDFRCAGLESVEICNPQGEWQPLMYCDPGTHCLDGECVPTEDGDISEPDGDERPIDGDDVLTDGDQVASDGDEAHPDGDVQPADNDTINPDGDSLSDGDNNSDVVDGASGAGGDCSQVEMNWSVVVIIIILLPLWVIQRRRSL